MSKVTVVYATPAGVRRGVSPYAAQVNRTWVLNGVGTAEETFAPNTPHLDVLSAPGAVHWIYERDVPPWVGVVVGRGFKAGSVTLRLKSAEQMLSKKVTHQGLKLDPEQQLGTLMRRVFDSGVTANSRAPLVAGHFDATGHTFGFLDYADVLATFTKIAEDRSKDFWVDENLAVHFRDRRGTDRRGTLAFRDNGPQAELLGVTLDEDYTETLSRVVMIGSGSGDIAEVDKVPRMVADPRPLDNTEAIKASNAETAADLSVLAAETLRTRGVPTTTVDAQLANVNGAWSKVNLGDHITLVLPLAAPQRPILSVRVVGLERGPTGFRALFKVDETLAASIVGWSPQ